MTVQHKAPTMKGPEQWFTGDVWIDSLGNGLRGPIGSVHFSPGARSAWHSHSIGQTLYVTQGEGRVQARGEQVIAIRTGDVVTTPAGEWHWHGAAPDHFMTHLSITDGETTWGDQVSDDEYSRAPLEQGDN